jgi:hypothetical protein
VQGEATLDRELLDAEGLVGQLVPPGSVFAFLAEHRRELFPDSFIADLFSSGTGRPSLPADLVGSVLVLKELFDLSDPQTADALKFDIRWKVACGRSLTQVSFDPSTLVYWRRRIAKSKRPDRVFDAVAAVITETGILRGRRKRCVDSTVFDDAVQTQDTVTQLVAAIRKVARLMPDAADLVARVCRLDYSQPGKPPIDWDDTQARQNLVSDLVNDALAILAELTGDNTPERESQAADALALLALVAGQDVEPADGSDSTDGRWRIARRVTGDRVISTVDVEARHTRKSKAVRKDGFRGHLVAEPETGLVTDCQLTQASGDAGSDPVVGEQMIARDRYHQASTTERGDEIDAEGADPTAFKQPADANQQEPADSLHDQSQDDEQEPEQDTTQVAVIEDNDEPASEQNDLGQEGCGLEVYADSAYGTGQARAKYRAAGHHTMIKPKPLRPAIDGGYTLDDFDINEHDQTVTCPAGHTRQMSAGRTVTFGHLCTDCPLRSRCTTAQAGRTMTIHPHEALLRDAREQARTPEFKQTYPTRSMIERIVAWSATQRGRRVKLRYRGTGKNDAWLHNRTAALNLRTLIGHGLTRQNGTWALA